MLERCGQLLSRLRTIPNLAGRGLPERMRTATVALLGVTAAISMAFVLVIAGQGWSVFPLGPIPGPGAGKQAVGAATALGGEAGGAEPVADQPELAVAAAVPAVVQPAQAGPAGSAGPGGTLSGSHAVAVPAQGGAPQGAPPAPGGESSPSGGETPPASQPVSTGATPSPPASTESGKGTAVVGEEAGKGNGKGHGQNGQGEESASASPAPTEAAPEEEAEEPEEEESGWWHGHGYGHRHHDR